MTDVVAEPTTPVAVTSARGEMPPWRLLLRRPTFIVGVLILLFWVMTFVIGAVAFGRSQRRWHHHGGWQRPRCPSGRHYTWL